MDILNEIRDCLQGVDIEKAIIFGSFAHGELHADSDVDLIVVIDRNEPFSSNEDYLKTCLDLRRRLRPISTHFGLDLLVFTIPDWHRFLEMKSAFAKEVQSTGLSVA